MAEINELIELIELVKKHYPLCNITQNEKYIELKYEQIIIKINNPTDLFNFYVCSSGTSKDYSFLNEINKICIKKNPTLKQIIIRLLKYISETNMTKSDEQLLKDKLILFLDKSVSIVVAEGSTKSLYDPKLVGFLIIDEYIKCLNLSKTSNKFILELNDNNIYSWKITMNNFTNTDIKNVSMFILFHDKLYPNYPPLINIVSPMFKNTLNHRISNSKMVQLNYWTPVRDTMFIINKIYSIIEKFGQFDSTQINIELPECVCSLNSLLVQLASYINSVQEDDIDADEKYILFNVNTINTKNHKTETNYWKKGTGYGHGTQTQWDPEEYIKLQETKNNVIIKILENINKILLCDINKQHMPLIIKHINQSLLLNYCNIELENSSLMSVQNNHLLINTILTTIKNIINSDKNIMQTYLNTLFKLKTLIEESLKINTNSILTDILTNINSFFICEEYLKELTGNDTIVKRDLHDDISLNYVSSLTELCYDSCPILSTNYKKEYVELFNKTSDFKQCLKRLSVELPSMKQVGQLPIHIESSIFFRVDDDTPQITRALITGPKDTPYENGCFIFDIFMTNEYPNKSPQCWFMNHGGVRFNPNLYACGKVCLSLLGTWSGGGKSEGWNSSTSNITQLLLSIQSLILIEEPYFNEPSHEISIKTLHGKKACDDYNNNIRLYTMKSTIRDLIKNTKLYPQFEDVIKLHFKLKKEHVLKTCKKWVGKSSEKLKTEYETVFNEIKTLLQTF